MRGTAWPVLQDFCQVLRCLHVHWKAAINLVLVMIRRIFQKSFAYYGVHSHPQSRRPGSSCLYINMLISTCGLDLYHCSYVSYANLSVQQDFLAEAASQVFFCSRGHRS